MENYNYLAEDNSEALEHHGILGQKWGQRRYQYEDGSLTPEGRKRYLKGTYTPVRTDGMRSVKNIKRGAKVFRVVPNEDRSNPTGPTFISYLEPDIDLYIGGYNQNLITRNKLRGIKNTSKYGYLVEYKLKKALKIPSREAVKDVTTKLMADEDFRNNAVKNILYMRSGDMFIDAVRLNMDKFDDSTKTEINKYYNHPDVINEPKAMLSMIYKDTKLASKVFPIVNKDFAEARASFEQRVRQNIDKNPNYAFYVASASTSIDPSNRAKVVDIFSKRGYNAMTDEHGVGTRDHAEGLDPLIIFDGADSLRKVSIKAITDEQYDEHGFRGVKWLNNVQNKIAADSSDVVEWGAL